MTYLECIATMLEQGGMAITARLLQPGYACFLAIKE